MTIFQLTVTQVVLIIALSGAASYSFYESFAYPHVRDAISLAPHSLGIAVVLIVATVVLGIYAVRRRKWLLGAVWFLVLIYFSGLLPVPVAFAGLSALVGIAFVVMRGQTAYFLVAVLALHFPSLMAFSSADWLWFVPDFAWETELTFASVSALSGFLVVGYLALRYTTQFKQLAADLLARGYEVTEVAGVHKHSLILALAVLLGAVLISGAVFAASVGLYTLVDQGASGVPARAVLLGVGASLVLIAAVYYALVRRKSA